MLLLILLLLLLLLLIIIEIFDEESIDEIKESTVINAIRSKQLSIHSYVANTIRESCAIR